jgi:hypothetical protein
VYVEGYATPEPGRLPVLHARVTDAENLTIAYDPTWKNGCEYFGIPFLLDYVVRVQENTGHPGVLDAWDVGAWNCDRNKESRDALVALAEDARGEPRWVGGCAGLNLRADLNEYAGTALISAYLRRCRVNGPTAVRTVSIDTPLGWPTPFRVLINTGVTVTVPAQADDNPYLFRQTERVLFNAGRRPLSAIRDMIGSQATKGIHFLTRTSATRPSVGVWETTEGVTVIETYPAPCKKSSLVCDMFNEIMREEVVQESFRTHRAFQDDLGDALRCAVIAWLYAKDKSKLAPPTEDNPAEEGWIWVPNDPPATTGSI